MIAVIEHGSNQFKVEEGTIIDVDRIQDPGKKVVFDQVLLVSDGKSTKVGQPTLKGAKVEAEVLNPEFKDKKVLVFKFKRKTGYKKTQGHRQKYTTVRIKKITTAAAAPKKAPAKVAKKSEKE